MNTPICVTISILFVILISIISLNSLTYETKESFSAPGLTLTVPPSWFPQNAARPYNPKDWQERMYLDRYPFYDTKEREYISEEESNALASTNRFWIQ